MIGQHPLAYEPEKLDDTRQTVRDVFTSHTTGVEGAHRQLGSRLANRLSGDVPIASPTSTIFPVASERP